MNSYFEIIDKKGVINSPIDSLDEAFAVLELLKHENFEFEGDVKIVEVHHIE